MFLNYLIFTIRITLQNIELMLQEEEQFDIHCIKIRDYVRRKKCPKSNKPSYLAQHT